MRITFDPAKRAATLAERGIDFADAAKVFAGETAERADERKEYGETRWLTAGWLDGRFVVLVWTPRGDSRRIISMRYGHAEEESDWRQYFGPRG